MRNQLSGEGAFRSRKFLIYPLILTGTIALTSHFSAPDMGSMSITGLDKLVHFLIYGLLATTWYEYWASRRLWPGMSLLLALLLSAGFGVADEFHQGLRPMRSFEFADMGADFLGAVVALAMYRVRLYRRILHTRVC